MGSRRRVCAGDEGRVCVSLLSSCDNQAWSQRNEGSAGMRGEGRSETEMEEGEADNKMMGKR